MSDTHQLLELRTSRDTAQTAASMVSVFENLPAPTSTWLGLRSAGEQLSWEISSIDQSTHFSVFLPSSQLTYLTALVASAYPSCLTAPAKYDPVALLRERANQASHAPTLLQLQPSPQRPLISNPTSDHDTLAPLLSLLAKSEARTCLVYQLCSSPHRHSSLSTWLRLGWNQIVGRDGATDTMNMQPAPATALVATLRVVVWHPDQEVQRGAAQAVAALLTAYSADPSHPVSVAQHPVSSQHWETLAHRILSKPHFPLNSTQASLLYHLPHAGLSTIHNIHWGKLLAGEPPEHLPIPNRETAPCQESINVIGRTSFKNKVVTFGIKQSDRRRHLYVIGKTGTGKSTLLANMAINDLKQSEGLCVIDPHGDLVETLLDYIPSHRTNDVIYFDPSDKERTVKLNLFEGEQVVHRELIASGIVSVFHKLYSYSWGPRLEYILRNALLTLLTKPAAQLSDITQLLTDKAYRHSIIDQLQDPILKNFWLNEFDAMSERVKTEAVAPVLNKVGQFVSSPLVRDVVNTRKSSFSVEQAMDEGKIILVNLSQGRLGEDNATLIGALLITKIQLAAMSRVGVAEENRRDFFLYVDEFQNFATESFVKILSEARKYRLNMILANQYIAQIPPEVQKAIFGNCGNLLNFVLGAEDAQLFSKEYSGLYSEQDLVNLGRYQVINRLTIDGVISSPFPAFTLPLATSKNSRRDKVIRNSRERYAR